ncbi:NlpC/P60 family protein [Alkalicoccus luteus]|uniref:Endopeptidase n=1 Tax=Alkalicoccus luteus TaxID=1237094 RepID=A0A969PNP3_9BACI|nr:NlpC/P60 family protein [Alkalicoccus luteus]NJP37565.1 endopeptidase [Alkalicoccus luteus]
MTIISSGGPMTPPQTTIRSTSYGDRSDFVKELQQLLADKGYNKRSNVDGIFGPITKRAVQKYQQSAGISHANGNFFGTAGPKTLGSLGLFQAGSASKTETSAPQTETASVRESSDSSFADRVIASGKEHMGTRYVWGGDTPSGFDCSGFIQYAFKENGKNLPRTVAQMWDAGTRVDQPQKGDLVFFETRTGPSHAGIYLGNNKFLHSGSSTGVTVTNMDNSYWKQRYLGAKSM